MIQVNLVKAKALAHNLRRRVRSELFSPLDVKVTIPSEAVKAENDRAIIRSNDAMLQTSIDEASTAQELKNLLPEYDEDDLLQP